MFNDDDDDDGKREREKKARRTRSEKHEIKGIEKKKIYQLFKRLTDQHYCINKYNKITINKA